MLNKIFYTILLLSLSITANSQYNPSAGKAGSSAIHKDSSIFVAWANQCKIIRGWKNIALKDSGFTTIGDSLSAIGKAGENGTVSLGDSGIAIFTFDNPITDGKGWDFAVFENAFDDNYLELAFVEISSDGKRFFRFPCHSLSDTINQTSSFGYTNPEKINNLAGKYRAGFGTPFDISEIPDYKDLDKSNIKYIKIIDVIGSLNPKFANYDTALRKINDPYPTMFPSGGFDLDAIGIINQKFLNTAIVFSNNFKINSSNPIYNSQLLSIIFFNDDKKQIKIIDSKGSLYKEFNTYDKEFKLKSEELPNGFFILIINGKTTQHYKGIKL